MEIAPVFELIMLVCFGFSWPINLIKNYKAGTAKNMSLTFILLILIGYVAGIASKIISNRINYVLVVYIINFIMVSIDTGLYFYNKSQGR